MGGERHQVGSAPGQRVVGPRFLLLLPPKQSKSAITVVPLPTLENNEPHLLWNYPAGV